MSSSPPLETDHSRDHMKPWPYAGVKSLRGRRKEMEDAVAVVHNLFPVWHNRRLQQPQQDQRPGDYLHFFAVYDGHGGSQAANYCRQRLHLALAEELKKVIQVSPRGREGDPSEAEVESGALERALESCFLRVDSEVTGYKHDSHSSVPDQAPLGSSDTVGSTAVVALLTSRHVVVANCGDSRAVLCRGGVATPLSTDHKPDREDEMARIEAAGGRVFNWDGCRVMGVLAMSRAIGDLFLKPFVIANPDVTFTPRTEEDDCLILASDGLWDVLSNDEACALARSCLYHNGGPARSSDGAKRCGAQLAASVLASAALEKGSGDNISVLVVDLRAPPHEAEEA